MVNPATTTTMSTSVGSQSWLINRRLLEMPMNCDPPRLRNMNEALAHPGGTCEGFSSAHWLIGDRSGLA
jgi:hypothetical protein